MTPNEASIAIMLEKMHRLALDEQMDKNRKARAEADLAELMLDVARRNAAALNLPELPKGRN